MKKHKLNKRSKLKVTTVKSSKVPRSIRKLPETEVEKKERQRQWAIKRKLAIRAHLFMLGKSKFE